MGNTSLSAETLAWRGYEMIPVTEKRFLAFRHLMAALAASAMVGLAFAQTTTDKAATVPEGKSKSGTEQSAEVLSEHEKGRRAYLSGDLSGAMGILRKAADNGDGASAALLGYILDKAEFNEEAIVYLEKAVTLGDPDGMYNLATMYLSSDGVQSDPERAAALLRKAAALGHMPAKQTLALAYINRTSGFDPDGDNREEARSLLLETSKEGLVPAMEALAKAYTTGEFGIPIDASKAKEWAGKVAEIRKAKKSN